MANLILASFLLSAVVVVLAVALPAVVVVLAVALSADSPSDRHKVQSLLRRDLLRLPFVEFLRWKRQRTARFHAQKLSYPF
jgi:hypothetical protein